MTKIGIMGGSGLDDPNILKDVREIEVDTPYGKPSSNLKIGRIEEIAFIIDLPDLKGSEKLKGYNIFKLVEFEGD